MLNETGVENDAQSKIQGKGCTFSTHSFIRSVRKKMVRLRLELRLQDSESWVMPTTLTDLVLHCTGNYP